MPRPVINDYTFYKIVCLDNSCDMSYVGSTADFKKRRAQHKYNCYNENDVKYNRKLYKTIRENGGWSNFKMIEIGKAEQITIREAERIEENYRQELNATMNGKRCYTTNEQRREDKKEWRENNKEHIKEYYENNKEHIKEYRENNKEHMKEYCKEYYENNKEQLKEYVKEYRENNKERIKQQRKEYYENNKELIKERKSEKIECACGSVITKGVKSRHEKTKKHLAFLNL